tara:strand:+ start:142 stop:723 length:582 start_codon:yes stop_codon:yes gene_type:complete
MNKFFLSIFLLLLLFGQANSNTKINTIYEGNIDAKIQIIVYESLTCVHCADFHRKVYPELKKNFIDKGLARIEFRNFPLDMAALNASKIAHCKNDGKSELLHFLYKNQKNWLRGNTVEEANTYLKKILDENNFAINFEECINNKLVENHILEDRIEASKKFEINSTPTLIINNKKFKKPLTYKNLKKTLEKLI